MKTGKKLLTVLYLIVAAFSILVVGTLSACGKKPGKTSSSSVTVEAGIEGRFYLAMQGDDDRTTIELELAEDKSYTLKLNGITSNGTYTLDGASLTLEGGDVVYTADYNGENVVFRYNDKQYLLVVNVEYLVRFMDAGDFMPEGLKIGNGKSLQAIKDLQPEKEGYRFIGWYTDAAKTKLLSWNTIVSGDITLYAKFASLAAEEYRVSLYDGDSHQEIQTVDKKLPELPEGGDGFIGWWISATDNGDELERSVKKGDAVNADVSLYAVYAAEHKLAVSIVGDKITWTKAPDAHSKTIYKVAVNGNSVYTASAKTEYALTAANINDYIKNGRNEITVVGTYQRQVGGSTKTDTYEGKVVFFKNRLAKPSIMRVEDTALLFAPVENATEYVLTFTCLDGEHVERLAAPIYEFAACAIPEGGMTFSVYATAPGYADSLVGTYRYEAENLAAVTGLNYDGQNKKIVWNAVENAQAYEVVINGATYNVETNEISLAELDVYGAFTVSVKAKAAGYHLADAVTAEFTRMELPQATGLRYDYDGKDETLYWNPVDGAKNYKLRAYGIHKGGTAGSEAVDIAIDNADATSAKLTGLGTLRSYAYICLELRACAENSDMDSIAKYMVLNSGLSYKLQESDFSYEKGVLSWTPIREIATYTVVLPNGETKEVETNYCDETVLVKNGRNEFAVKYLNKGNEIVATYGVEAYSVSFETLGSSVATKYAAVGDVVVLPTDEVKPYRIGYVFDGWFADVEATEAYGDTFVMTAPESVVVYAGWQNAEYNLTLDVGEYGQPLDEDKSVLQVTYKSKVAYLNGVESAFPVPEVGSDTSRLFLGWYTEPGGGGRKLADQFGIPQEEYIYAGDSTAYAYFITAFKFVPHLVNPDNKEDVISYSVRKGTNIDSFNKSTVRVPATYNGKPVDYIESEAFKGCEFSVLEIPNSIFTIELISDERGSAFAGCRYLEAVNVYEVETIASKIRYFSDDGVLYFENEDQVTEYDRTEVAYVPVYKKGEVVISDKTEYIPYGTMGSLDGDLSTYDAGHDFTSVVIPYSVVEIDEKAFISNTYLVDVKFTAAPDGVEAQPLTICQNAFYGCTKLVAINLPARLNDFGQSIFENCTYLESVSIEDGNDQFVSIDGVMFEKNGEGAAETLIFFPRGIKYDEEVLGSGEYVIPDGVTTIASNAFSGSKLKKVTIGSDVIDIQPYAFSGVSDKNGKSLSGTLNGNYKGTSASYLEEIVFVGGDKPLEIGEGAFYGSGSKLKEVTLPRNLVKLGKYAFANKTMLKTVNIELDASFASANTIDYDTTAFISNVANKTAPIVEVVNLGANVPVIDTLSGMFGSKKLIEINIDKDNTNYLSTDGVLYDFGVTKILYFFESREGEYVLPETITEIPEGTFRDKENLPRIVIHAGVKSIGDEAFKNCKNLETVVINDTPEGKEVVELNFGDYVFQNCLKLVDVQLPGRMRTAGKGLFTDVRNILDIVIPEGVIELGDYAFGSENIYAIMKLERVTLPSTLVRLGEYEVVNGIDTLKNFGVFARCTNIVSITLTENTAVAEDDENRKNKFLSFEGGILYGKVYDKVNKCYVDHVLIGASKAETEDGTLTVKENVTKVWGGAFAGNVTAESLVFEAANEETLPEELKGKYALEIGENAFADCVKLANISLPVGLSEIRENTFKNCTSLEKVIIPWTVKKIVGYAKVGTTYSNSAFSNCANLKTVEFQPTPDGETAIPLEISDGYYTSSSGSSSSTGGPTVTVYSAFYKCPALETIEFPERLTYLGDVTFGHNTSIKRVVLPASLTSVGYGVFMSATALERVTFLVKETVVDNATGETVVCSSLGKVGPSMFSESGVSVIDVMTSEELAAEKAALANGETVTHVAGKAVLPEGIGSIACYGFYECLNITDVVLPSTITIIGEAAKNNPNNSTSTLKTKGYAFKDSKNIKTVTFAENSRLETIETYSFGTTGLTNIELPASLDLIETYAFNTIKNDENTLKITFAVDDQGKSALKKIGNYAFKDSVVSEISFPETAAELVLGQYIFQNCANIQKVYFPSTVAAIKDVFNGCKSDLTLTISPDNKNLTVDENAPLILGKKTITENDVEKEVSIIKVAYAPIKSETFEISENCVEIETTAFKDQQIIKKVIIPAGLTTIGEKAFDGCSYLVEVEFKYKDGMNELGIIGVGAFQNCTRLRKVVIPNNYINKVVVSGKTLGSQLLDDTFGWNYSLEKVGVTPDYEEIANLDDGVYLPNNLVYLGGTKAGTVSATSSSNKGVFFRCPALISVTLPATVTKFGGGAFSGCAALSEFTYEGATQDGNVISNTVEQLGNVMFENTKSLKTIRLTTNSKVKSIPQQMFLNSGIESINIPKNYTGFGNGVFTGTAKLRTITFEDASKLTTLGSNMFSGSGIEEIKLPAVKSLGATTFKNAVNLKTVEIPKVTSITVASVFEGCTSLESIDLSAVKTLTGASMFKNCTALKEVKFNDAVTELGKGMFEGCTSFTGVKMNDDGTVALDENGNYEYTLKLPASLIHIGVGAFKNSGIIAIRLPSKITALTTTLANAKKAATYGNYNVLSETFNGCVALERVEFAGAVDHIGKNSFLGCTSLKEVVGADGTADGLFNNIKYIGDAAFKSTQIKRVSFNKLERTGNEVFMDSAVEEVYFANPVIYNAGKAPGMGNKMFYNCKNLKGVECGEDGKPLLNEDGTYKNYTLVLPTTNNFGNNTFEGSGVIAVKFNKGTMGIGSNSSKLFDEDTAATYNGYSYLFRNCVDLESVEFEGANIKYIPSEAFNGCTKLNRVIGLENVVYIGKSAFKNTAISSKLELNKVETISDSAFENSAVAEVTFSDKLANIGSKAFAYNNLTSLKFVNKVIFGANAFENCKELTEVSFSKEQEVIPSSMFAHCSKLSKVNLPNSIYSIQANAFINTALSGKIKLPTALEEIGAGAFFGTGITGFNVADDSEYLTYENGVLYSLDGEEDKTLIMVTKEATGTLDLSGVTHIKKYAFAYAENYENIIMPEGEVVIDSYAFSRMVVPATLDRAALLTPEFLRALPNYAFADATGLGELVFPEGTNFDPAQRYLFMGSDVTSVTIPASMTVVPKNMFNDCEKLTTVNFADGVKEIYDYAFSNTGLTSVTIPASVRYMAIEAFSKNKNLTDVTFADGFARIGSSVKYTVVDSDSNEEIEYASSAKIFIDSAIERLNIPSTLVAIGASAFENNKIKALRLPAGLEVIGSTAFKNNEIETLEFATNDDGTMALTDIPASAFALNKLTNVTFVDNSIQSIGDNAFLGHRLTKLVLPEGLKTVGKNAFAGNAPVEVLDEAGEATGELDYSACSPLNEIVLPASLKVISEGAFADNYYLAKVNLENVEELNKYAFRNAATRVEKGLDITFTDLRKITVTAIAIDRNTSVITNYGAAVFEGANVDKITFTCEEACVGKLLFGMAKMPEIVLPENMTYIPEYFYSGCTFEEVTIPAYIEVIGRDAFEFCYNLKTVKFEEGSKLRELGTFVFNCCINLESIELPDTLEYMDTWAFQGDKKLKEVFIPSGTYVKASCFAYCGTEQIVRFASGVTLIYDFYNYSDSTFEFGCERNA